MKKLTMREILLSSEKLEEFLRVTHDPGCTGWIPFDEREGRIACATCNSDLKKKDNHTKAETREVWEMHEGKLRLVKVSTTFYRS